MKQGDELFDLIHSLEKNESGISNFLRPYKKGEKIYITLFDTLDRQSFYDEKSLLLRFKKTPQQFSAVKNYLYSLILKSLRNYEQGGSVNFEIRELLNSAEILLRKGLYSQTSKLLARAKRTAQQHGKYTSLLDGIEAEHQLSYFFGEEKDYFQKLKEAAEETRPVLDKLNYLQSRIALVSGLVPFWKKGKPRKAESVKEIEKHFSKIQLKKDHTETFESTWYFYYIKQHVYRLTFQYEEAYVYGKKAVEHMESSPEKIRDDIQKYFISLYNLMVVNIELRRYRETLAIIKKIRSLSDKPFVRLHKGISAKIFSLTHLVEMLMHADYGEFEKAYKLLLPTEEGLKKYNHLLTSFDKVSIYYGLSYTYFCKKEYKKALLWLNLILNDPGVRPDIYLFARIANLLIHFELGNLYMLDNLLRSTYSFLYKRKVLYESEKAIILSLKKLVKVPDQKAQIKIVCALKDALTGILSDSHEKILLDYIDILSWLDSKIQNKPFEDIIREKLTFK